MSRKLTHSHVIEARARAMRFTQTPTEEALFSQLRGGELGVVVRRQYVIGRYIADLAVPSARLVIEVDGEYHAARRVADARRGQMVLGTPVLTQNGFFYLFIDGTCRYWVYGSKEIRGWWQATHTGVLSPESAKALTADLELASWTDLNETGQGCVGSTVFLWRKGALLISHSCDMPDPIIPALSKKAKAWVDDLWPKGTAVETPVRLAAVAIPPSLDDPKRPTTTLSIDLAPIALSYPQGHQLEQETPALLISEAGLLAELRKDRERVIAGDYLLFDGDSHVLPVRQNGALYFVYFRDTLPLEDSNGLIRLAKQVARAARAGDTSLRGRRAILPPCASPSPRSRCRSAPPPPPPPPPRRTPPSTRPCARA